MNRNVSALNEREYDLVIVGGGIFGICAAWDAALRGLSVALVERGDFCHATSANHYKIVHGGIRYLQHADLVRIRESSRERNALLRIAPHLVRPFPIVIPTYGHGMQGKEIMAAALLIYNLTVFDRNRGLNDPERRIPFGRIISRKECLDLFPGLEKKDLTGAVLFYDGQVYNPSRLALSFLRSAVQAGAYAGNYLEVSDFLRDGNRVFGVRVQDKLSGKQMEIRGKVVLNAAGPWAERLLGDLIGLQINPKLSYSRDACFVVARRLTGKHALAVQAKTRDPDAILSRGHRHLFITSWRDYTLIGVWHLVHTGAPGEFTVTEDELQGFLNEINEAYPPLALKLKDILMWNAGLVLFGDNESGATDLSYGKRSLVIDHAKEHQVDGLITVIGVRATTSRGVAEKVINRVLKKLGKKSPKSITAVTPIYGGHIERFEEFQRQAVDRRPSVLTPEVMRALTHNHGSMYPEILKYVDENPTWAEMVGVSNVIKAEVIHAVREEMAQKLGDVVFRRTDLGTGEHPGDAALRTCADLMASELGWSEEKLQKEIEEVKALLPCEIRSEHDSADNSAARERPSRAQAI